MSRWYRLLLTVLIVAFSALGIRPAHAEPTAELGQARTVESIELKSPELVLPHDVPLVFPKALEALTPVPASYVTKDLGWLELSYPPSAAERVMSLVRDADAIKAELTSSFEQPILEHVTVRVAETSAEMARLAPRDAPPPSYASGVAYHGLHLVLLSMMAPRGADAVDLDEVFRHELTHVAIEDALQGRHVPVWFNEGLAISFSHERALARSHTLWSATLSGTLIPLSELDRHFPRDDFEVNIAYAESADFMRFLDRKSDRLRFRSMIGRLREGQTFDRAINDAYGSDLHRLEFEWRSDLEHRFSVIPILTGGGLIWVLVIVALVAAYVRRRRQSKAILARWEREEALEDARLAKLAAERAAVQAASDRAAVEADAERQSVVVQAANASTGVASIKIEHHGRWHTLH